MIRAPVFGLWPKRARNGPKLENRTTPSVFELQFSNAQIVFTLPSPKNCWTKILIQVPVLGLGGPKNGQNFKIFVFGRRGFKFSEGNSYLLYEIIYAIIFGVGAHLGVPVTLKVGHNCQNFKIVAFGRSGLKFSRCSHICYCIRLTIGP